MYKGLRLFGLANFIFWFALIFCTKTVETQGHGRKTSTNSLQAEEQIPPSSALRAPKKWALLVGINKYRNFGNRPDYSNLEGCINDVEDMKTLLIGKFDFPKANIWVLTDEMATHAGIVKAFEKHLIANAKSNDIIVFYFSGHGSQMPDNSGDEIDGKDETIVPHDTRDREGKVFDISDDEINELLRQLAQKTKNIAFIFDSCHSGTAVRGAGRPRKIPPDDRTPPPSPPYAPRTRGIEGESDLRPENLNYVLIAGSRSGETSFEYLVDDKEHGALTYFLTRELRSAGPSATYRDVMDKVMGKVNATFFNQHPQLEGARADFFVFSDSTSAAEPYVLTSPLTTGKVIVEAGQVQGMTEGSIFEIYGPATKKFEDPVKPIATIELTKVMPFKSEGKIISGNPAPPPASRAVERHHQYPDLKLVLYYEGLSKSPNLREIEAKLNQYAYIETTPVARDYHLLLRQQGDDIVIEGGDSTQVAARFTLSTPGVVDSVADCVNQWVRWFNLLSISNATPKVNVKFTVTATRGTRSRAPFANIGKAEAVLYEDETLQFTVENPSKKKLYITMLDLSSNGKVEVIYPPEGETAELPAGASWSDSSPVFVPLGLDAVKDILKVFATTRPIDFHFLKKESPVKRGEIRALPVDMNDPLGLLLAQASLSMTRGVGQPISLDNWITAERVIEVRRRAE